MKTWNLGNTTVRNPERIAAGLRVLKRFEGQRFDETVQVAFYEALRDEGILSGDMQPSGQAISGRKWAAAANQMGFAVALKSRPPVVITEAGNRLLLGEPLATEAWLRQLLKVELPPPLETSRLGQYEGFSIHPFAFMLRVTLALEDLGLEGPSRQEIALFLVTSLQDDDVQGAAVECAAYRRAIDGLRGSVARRNHFVSTAMRVAARLYADEVDERCDALREVVSLVQEDAAYLDSADCAEQLRAVCAGGKGPHTRASVNAFELLTRLIREGAEWETLVGVVAENRLRRRATTFVDYADTTIRYCRMSGLFTVRGARLVISEDAQDAARRVADWRPPSIKADLFSEWFWSADRPELPSDDASFLRNDLRRLSQERASLAAAVSVSEVEAPDYDAMALPQLKLEHKSTADDVARLREEFFYRRQAECLPEILHLLQDIEVDDDMGPYRPALLEWAVWRSLLAVDAITCRVADTRNFPVDSDVNPLHTAKGGVADMVFEYVGHTLAVEVTLRTGPNQWSAEGEPVPRHVFDVMRRRPDQRTLGLFLAPRIDPNTANQFLAQVYWSDDIRDNVAVDIVPLTLRQYGCLLRSLGQLLKPDRLLHHLDDCLSRRTSCQHGPAWLAEIDRAVRSYAVETAAS
ncbi:MAG: AlwI family type II restriction endonuclease [Coriobacteriia bacterium]|nr:AlwI family type II restriction endonuclease [Coriobacteriia bacterium]